jgi:hypothetical protein
MNRSRQACAPPPPAREWAARLLRHAISVPDMIIAQNQTASVVARVRGGNASVAGLRHYSPPIRQLAESRLVSVSPIGDSRTVARHATDRKFRDCILDTRLYSCHTRLMRSSVYEVSPLNQPLAEVRQAPVLETLSSLFPQSSVSVFYAYGV